MSCATSVARAGSFRFYVRHEFGEVPQWAEMIVQLERIGGSRPAPEPDKA